MNRSARATIQRLRAHGFRVLFMCDYDASITVSAVSCTREAYIVKGKLCDDSRLISELAKMTGLGEEANSERSTPGALGNRRLSA
jgi:hypothetical protein